MTAARVSVLLPTYNRATFLSEALDSILSQTAPPSQVIVVNDGSTDTTTEILTSYGDRIEVINKPNSGKASSLNLALSRTTGDYVWIFDDDDVALPDSLERHLGILDSRPDLGFTYSACYVCTTGPEGRIVDKTLKPLPEISSDEVFVRLLEGCFMQQQAVLARRSCYREVGGYDARLICSEDYDIMLKLARRFACAAIPEPTFLFRQHGGPRGSKNARYAASERVSRWIEYNRVILQDLYLQLPLTDYLPFIPGARRQPAERLSPDRRRRALLQRICVMARAGLWRLALDDLQAVVDADLGQDPQRPLEDSERHIVRLALGRYIGRYVAIESLICDREFQRRIAAFRRGPVVEEMRLILVEELSAFARAAIASKRDRLAARAFALAARCSRWRGP
jgi:glycosyltransferase involved in cell wall biosynthesis